MFSKNLYVFSAGNPTHTILLSKASEAKSFLSDECYADNFITVSCEGNILFSIRHFPHINFLPRSRSQILSIWRKYNALVYIRVGWNVFYQFSPGTIHSNNLIIRFRDNILSVRWKFYKYNLSVLMIYHLNVFHRLTFFNSLS